MEEFDKILYGFIFSIVGIVVGWFLNQIGQWFKVRSDQKKTLRFVLFNLLETYHLFSKSDFDSFTTKISNKVKSYIPNNEQTIETETYIDQIFSDLVTNYLKPRLLSELNEIENDYKNSILSLAEIDPITAYYLNGKSSILERFEQMESWMKMLEYQNPNDAQEIKKSSKLVMEIIKPNMFTDTQTELEKDIKKIAFKINPVVWYNSGKAIDRVKENLSKEIDKEIDEIFDKLKSTWE
ncbi:hypothetical protein CLV33_1187 [Jejuia pallidilutea]|uniref:Uncharacterized protein n=1 Tax=Jejuia pallidilutea TaxID=504487 RepID=A0A362WWU8_9FLAO|nr:hypothetical protein [Jejuia pallidilutea]PQV44728.1 hypothetical protein CLV33_1187 [Jejuia pallidilutea]